LIAVLVAAPGSASAQGDYPNRTIRIIVPAPPGPMLDTLPRLIGAKLAERWGQPVVVENRPGAAQTLGAEAVAKAPPDGYTILFTPPGPLVVTQHLAKLNYDAAAFTPITVMVKVPAVFLAHPKVPAATFAEFIAYAKANPGKITYGSPGAGSSRPSGWRRPLASA
jgi:tripartite-type tricarboxylate transporter receptor subunit TctC